MKRPLLTCCGRYCLFQEPSFTFFTYYQRLTAASVVLCMMVPLQPSMLPLSHTRNASKLLHAFFLGVSNWALTCQLRGNTRICLRNAVVLHSPLSAYLRAAACCDGGLLDLDPPFSPTVHHYTLRLPFTHDVKLRVSSNRQDDVVQVSRNLQPDGFRQYQSPRLKAGLSWNM